MLKKSEFLNVWLRVLSSVAFISIPVFILVSWVVDNQIYGLLAALVTAGAGAMYYASKLIADQGCVVHDLEASLSDITKRLERLEAESEYFKSRVSDFGEFMSTSKLILDDHEKRLYPYAPNIKAMGVRQAQKRGKVFRLDDSSLFE